MGDKRFDFRALTGSFGIVWPAHLPEMTETDWMEMENRMFLPPQENFQLWDRLEVEHLTLWRNRFQEANHYNQNIVDRARDRKWEEWSIHQRRAFYFVENFRNLSYARHYFRHQLEPYFLITNETLGDKVAIGSGARIETHRSFDPGDVHAFQRKLDEAFESTWIERASRDDGKPMTISVESYLHYRRNPGSTIHTVLGKRKDRDLLDLYVGDKTPNDMAPWAVDEYDGKNDDGSSRDGRYVRNTAASLISRPTKRGVKTNLN